MGISLETILLGALPVVLAITLHEAAHGYVAKLFGDRTAEMLGRVTLNPIRHVDPVGTVLLPGAMLLLGSPFIFGWAKPVPVNFNNLRHPKRDMIWVAGAGPGSNFVQALVWAMVFVAATGTGALGSVGLAKMAQIGLMANLVLMALNLLPIPPLDGGRILMGVLPGPASYSLSRLEPYGLFIVVLLLVTGVLDSMMRPLIDGAVFLITALLGR